MTMRLLYLFLFSFFALAAFSQAIEEKNFVLYTTKEGLSNNVINAITQDDFGYIWIATNKGLNRFDGTSFQLFYSDSNRNSLPDDFTHRLRWLDKERLAVITAGGLHIVNCRTLQQNNIVIPADSLKSLLPLNRAMDAYADNKGNLFIGTATGFYQFDAKNKLVFRYDNFSRKYIQEKRPVAFVTNIIPLEQNILLVSTFVGPYMFYIDKKDFHLAGSADNPFYQKVGIPGKPLAIPHFDATSFSSIMAGDENFSWFETRSKTKYPIKVPCLISDNIDGGMNPRLVKLSDTLFAVNRKVSGFYLGHHNRITDSYELSSNVWFKNMFCHSLFVDKNNQLWIGTDKGLFKEKKSASIIEQLTTPSSFTGDIQSLSISGNRIFAGTINQGILIFDRDSLKLKGQLDFTKQRKDLPYANFILDILAVNKDTLYTAIPGAWINTKNLNVGEIPLVRVDTSYKALDLVFKDSRNNIYLKKGEQNVFYYRSSFSKSFVLLDYRSELAKIGFDVSGLAEDPEGNIWFSGSGIMRFNTSEKKFDLLLDSFPSIKLPSKGISSNLVFDKNYMYFGVYANGLMLYDQKLKNISQLTRADGLPDNNILALHLYHSKLWIATENGLACYDLTTKKISSFGTSDGIPLFNGSKFSLYFDSTHHQLYGAFKNTIFRFDPDILTKNNLPPDFSIESIVIPGKETIFHPADKINLTYKQNSLILNLAAVNFEDAYQQQFAYRLVKEGDEPWILLGPQRSIVFSSLSPGNHRLQVKVFIRNQSWPDQFKEITISIYPPFWKTIWFIGILVLILAGFAYYIHRRRINQITQKANLDKQLAQTEMKALHSQMNPHFIFNCLNSIREMILNNENEQASLYLGKFARLIRITLNHSSKQFVSLEDTIDYLQRYLEMEQIRTTNFRYNIEIDNNFQPDEIFLPPMLIQPFIENSIWHGAIPEKIMTLAIRFQKKQDKLICIVEDDGIGIDVSLSRKEQQLNYQSVGISNIKQRIDVLNEKYNLQSSIEIFDKSTSKLNRHSGTIITLHLPIKTKELLL